MTRPRHTPHAKGDMALSHIPSEDEDAGAGPSTYNLLAYPADFTLEGLHRKWVDKEIDIRPFQRRYVWKLNQASKLIESFLLGLPVPGVFLYMEPETGKLLVVDGQQRLRSVFYYFEGKFPARNAEGKYEPFALKLDSESHWNGKLFTDLTPEEGRRLQNSVMRSVIMKQLKPVGDASIYHVFERLNTGGTLLSNQEVRNAVCHGEFNDLLVDMNKRGSWRDIVGLDTPDKRMRDVELILRFLALHTDLGSYHKPMKEFLTEFMMKHRHGDCNQQYKAYFDRVSDEVRNVLGQRPFHIERGLNAAVYDAVFVAFARKPGARAKALRKRYQALLKDVKFRSLTETATTDDDTLRRRLDLATRKLFG